MKKSDQFDEQSFSSHTTIRIGSHKRSSRKKSFKRLSSFKINKPSPSDFDADDGWKPDQASFKPFVTQSQFMVSVNGELMNAPNYDSIKQRRGDGNKCLQCICNRKECNGMAAAFSMMDDPRGCYTKIPELCSSEDSHNDMVLRSLRECFLEAVVSPKRVELSRSSDDLLVANLHFPPALVQWSPDQKSSIIPMFISKDRMEELSINFSEDSRVVDSMGSVTDTYFVVPGYDFNQAEQDLKAAAKVRSIVARKRAQDRIRRRKSQDSQLHTGMIKNSSASAKETTCQNPADASPERVLRTPPESSHLSPDDNNHNANGNERLPQSCQEEDSHNEPLSSQASTGAPGTRYTSNLTDNESAKDSREKSALTTGHHDIPKLTSISENKRIDVMEDDAKEDVIRTIQRRPNSSRNGKNQRCQKSEKVVDETRCPLMPTSVPQLEEFRRKKQPTLSRSSSSKYQSNVKQQKSPADLPANRQGVVPTTRECSSRRIDERRRRGEPDDKPEPLLSKRGSSRISKRNSPIKGSHCDRFNSGTVDNESSASESERKSAYRRKLKVFVADWNATKQTLESELIRASAAEHWMQQTASLQSFTPSPSSHDELKPGGSLLCVSRSSFIYLAGELGRSQATMEKKMSTWQETVTSMVENMEAVEAQVVEAWDSYVSAELGSQKRPMSSFQFHHSPCIASMGTSHVWTVRMRYKMAVATQARTWQTSSTTLRNMLQAVEETRTKHLNWLREILVYTCSRAYTCGLGSHRPLVKLKEIVEEMERRQH